MVIMRIAFKELLMLRDIKMLLFMLVIPMSLILILGTALSGGFQGSVTVGDIRILYQNNAQGSPAAHYWDAFVRESEKSGIQFEHTDKDVDESAAVSSNQYAGYVSLTDSGMEVFINSQNSVENTIAMGMLTAFADRYKLAAVLAKSEPEQADRIMAGSQHEDLVDESSLLAARKPGALDYYAIAVTTMIILYGAATAAQLIEVERKRNTAIRLMAAPISRAEILTGKILGNLLMNFVFAILLVLISKYMFQAYWGDNLLLVLLILLSEIVFALCLGLGLSYLFKGNAAGAIVMGIIQLAALFGGSYFPSEEATGLFGALAAYSPLQWSNDAILQVIYADNVTAAGSAMLLNVGLGILFLVMAVVFLRKREGI